MRDSLFHATVIKWTKENVKKRKRKKITTAYGAFLPPKLRASPLQLFSIAHFLIFFLKYKTVRVFALFGEKSWRDVLICGGCFVGRLEIFFGRSINRVERKFEYIRTKMRIFTVFYYIEFSFFFCCKNVFTKIIRYLEISG